NRQGELVQQHAGFYADKTADYEQELVNLLKE
ncbi:MAG: TlpA family protein disulfide reductase, partial [Shewanella sp.]